MNTINQLIESTTVRKTMIRILPFTFICYIVAYLDRVNLGFAALQMNTALALSSQVFGLLSGIFFFGYFLFEIPSNMIMHKIGPRLWIARIMITWGIVTSLTALVHSATQLYIVRFLLGVAEAGFFPGIILYYTYWFRGQERGRASASLMLAMPLGTIIGAPLSTWIMSNIAWHGMAGWRWMFVIEGIPAVVLGVITLFYLNNRPKDAKWLTDDEKKWLENELDKERNQSLAVNKASNKEMIKDSKVWKLAFIYFCNYTAMYALGFWFPTIIKSLARSSNLQQIGWLTIIPALIGIVSMSLFGWNSDRTKERKIHLISSFVIAAIGYIMAGFAHSTVMMIVMISIAAVGLYGFIGSFFAFMTMFFTESTAPAGIATVNSFAAIGGFVGPMIFGQMAISKGMFVIGTLAILAVLMVLTLKTQEVGSSVSKGSINHGTAQ